MTNRNTAFSRSDRTFRTFPTFRLGNAAKSGASAPGFFRSLHEFKWFFRLTDDFSRRIFPQTQQIPVILRSRGFIWRRRRDLNSRADFSTYSLSRGAPSPAWVRLHVKLCSFRGFSCSFQLNKKFGGTGGIHFLWKIHGGCNMPPACCQEPPFESQTHPVP